MHEKGKRKTEERYDEKVQCSRIARASLVHRSCIARASLVHRSETNKLSRQLFSFFLFSFSIPVIHVDAFPRYLTDDKPTARRIETISRTLPLRCIVSSCPIIDQTLGKKAAIIVVRIGKETKRDNDALLPRGDYQITYLARKWQRIAENTAKDPKRGEKRATRVHAFHRYRNAWTVIAKERQR